MASHTTVDVESALRDLAAELRDDIPDAVESGLAKMRQEAPEFFVRDDDPEFVATYRQSYQQQLRFLWDGLESGRDLSGREPPPMSVEEARLAAAHGIPLSALLLTYRICQRLLFESALQKAERRFADPELRVAVLRLTSRWLFDYIDWQTVHLTEAFERERDLLVRDRERRKRQLVRDLLDGEPVHAGQLGYELDQQHLGLVAWGHQPERALAALRDASGLVLFTVAGASSATWGWLGGREIGQRALRRMRDAALPTGAYLAIGEPTSGIDGFRLTHRQAWNTYRIARDAGGPAPVTWHRDAALLALTLQDVGLAREFVLRELGPLAESDDRAELLRETLTAYFAAGQNAAAAGAALDVHDRTVLYRIRSIEDRLGYPIAARREELAVALRLAPIVLRD